MADAPMLHHRSTSAGMWDHCTGIPRRPAFVRRTPRHTHRQLLLTPWLPPLPPVAPPHAALASSTTKCASCASLASHHRRASRAKPASTPPAAPRRPPLPSVAPLFAKPVSDPSNRYRAGQAWQPLLPTASHLTAVQPPRSPSFPAARLLPASKL
uniref:Uncharacterized protein n=1 Tax=Oryza sativa subsp. japonica TaxID=39947 RepID=Q8H4C5_ORYSJ|nr:hypothetical protein [Oryza sativa Japonica Group]BAD31306.1 hypothetical protein [Oryza sativa Japonica Group]